jgi:hypothetical protein
MNWDHHIAQLAAGRQTQFRPRGSSMVPLIYSGQLVTVAPITDPKLIAGGDIVFCKVRGNFYVHKVEGWTQAKGFQIGNNRGHINGWTRSVFGKVVKVED